MEKKRGQASFEYMILMGFVILVLTIILGIAFFYTNSVQDRIRISQLNNFANKVTTTAEFVYSAGAPSKSTINTYLPEGVTNITITENLLVLTVQTSSGTNTIGFPSTVNITGNLTASPGLKKLAITAETTSATIHQI